MQQKKIYLCFVRLGIGGGQIRENPGEADRPNAWTDRIYHVQIPNSKGMFGEAPVWNRLEGYFTLRAIP